MRINPIETAYVKPVYAYKHLNSNPIKSTPDADEILTPLPDNYGRALVFKSSKDEALRTFIKNAPFEDKLAIGLNELYKGPAVGNILMVVQHLKDAKKMAEYLELPTPIQKLSIFTSPETSANMFFSRVGNTITLINTSDVPFVLDTLDFLDTGDFHHITIGDHICTPDGWFTIKVPEDESILEKYSDMFLKTMDFTGDISAFITKHNEHVKLNVNDLISKKQASKPLTFESVGGQDEVIDALKRNVVFPLMYPEVYDGFMMSRGVVLYGPPGTGKTLIAKALASESNASFFELCATDLSDKYVGESEKNCRELFARAVDAQPSIIYFDEIDALGKSRGEDIYNDKLLTQLLSLMSDLEYRGDNVFVIGSTNRREDLDSAFTRSGRFSTLLEVKAPDLKGTKQIFKIHTENKPIDKDVDVDEISQKMYLRKMTGADIALVVKEAFSHALQRTGIYASMCDRTYSPIMKEFLTINAEDFNYAIDNFKNGSGKKTSIGFNK